MTIESEGSCLLFELSDGVTTTGHVDGPNGVGVEAMLQSERG